MHQPHYRVLHCTTKVDLAAAESIRGMEALVAGFMSSRFKLSQTFCYARKHSITIANPTVDLAAAERMWHRSIVCWIHVITL